MRYIILNKEIREQEIADRKKYIEKTTGIKFLRYDIDGGVEFVSYPSNLYDCVIIVGHNDMVTNYINTKEIPEKNIAIISCTIIFNERIKKNKNIYVSFNTNKKTPYYNGKEWNLNFDISKEELQMINDVGNIMDRIQKSFRRF